MNKLSIFRVVFGLCINFSVINAMGQEASFEPNLTYKRGFIDTKILQLGVKTSSKNILDFYLPK